MQYVFMTEQIYKKSPKKPVIRVQAEDGSAVDANCFQIKAGGQVIGHVVYEPYLDACDTHQVKAWVEFHDAVELIPHGKSIARPAKPKASEKKPNSKVTLK